MRLVVVGAHLKGLPLHGQLTERKAEFVAATRTAPKYLLFALPGTTPPKPGLLRTDVVQAQGIEVEVYDLAPAEFASFVELIPPPLSLGNIELQDGSVAKGFLVEHYATLKARDITALGGWRNYLRSPGG